MSRRPSQSLLTSTSTPPRQKQPSPALFGGLLLLLLAFLEACWFFVGALLRPFLPGGWWAVVGVGLLIVMPLVAVVRGFSGGEAPSAFTRIWVIRPFWYSVLLLPTLALGGLLGGLVGLPFDASGAGGRTAMAILGMIFALVVLAGYHGTRQLVVRYFEVRLGDLPRGFEGVRIAQLSDLHVGPHTSRRFLEQIAAAVREVEPDLLVFTGDQVDDYASDVEHFAAAFAGLCAPLGVFAIAGNHDVYAGWSAVRRGMEEVGIKVLVNDSVVIERGGDRLWIAGTGDPAGSQWLRDGGRGAAPDVERTLASIPPGAVILALAHNPALWPALAARGVQFTLSGHTHHGQLSIPSRRWSLASVFLELSMGTYQRGGSLLYINPGTNYWGIPFRIGALPEVTVLTLRRGEAGDESEMVERFPLE